MVNDGSSEKRPFGFNDRFMAVGYNGGVVKKESFASLTLKDGDVLEVVRPVGGG